MRVKGTKQLGSFTRGINLSPIPEIINRKNKLIPQVSAPPIPANGQPLLITIGQGEAVFTNILASFTYSNLIYYQDFYGSNYTLTLTNYGDGIWTVRVYSNITYSTVYEAQVAGNNTEIPTSGWVYTVGTGNPIVITEAQ